MAGTTAQKPAIRPGQLPYAELAIVDFSGGLNVRDAATELKENESPDLMNVVIDERGGVAKRLGYSVWNAAPLPNLVTYGYESDVCNCVFWYTKADGKLYRDTNGIASLARQFAAGADLSMADFAGVCYATHGFDGLFGTTDGSTWSRVVASSGQVPSGDMCAVWQNKLWVASSGGNRLWFCAPGDVTLWDPKDDAGSNDLREGNDFPINCLFGTSGVDITAQPALLVGKRSGAQGSTHRVVDAATGNYVTIDQAIGPAGPQALTSLYGQLYMISTSGVYQTDGQTALLPIGSKLSKMFDPGALDYAQSAGFVAGRTRDRVRFSIARTGSVGNDLALEYHPAFQAFTTRTDAAACYVTRGQQDGILLGASPQVVGRIWQFDTGGADDGAPIESRMLTRVFQPGAGGQLRLQYVRILGRGRFTIDAMSEFATTGRTKDTVLVSEGFGWDSDGWDDPTVGWGEDLAEGWGHFYPRQLGRAFQIRISEISTSITTTPPLLETGASLTVGAWAVYGLQLHFSSLHPIV